jgi:hypothetical protein
MEPRHPESPIRESLRCKKAALSIVCPGNRWLGSGIDSIRDGESILALDRLKALLKRPIRWRPVFTILE